MALLEPKKIQYNAQAIGAILPSSLMESIKKAQQLATSKCNECGKEYNKRLSVLGACPVCYRKASFKALPAEQQELFVVDIVRERYKNAALVDLSKRLRNELLGCNNDGAYIWGKPGVGKTYALAALVRHYIPLGFAVKRISYEKLCLQIRDSFKPLSKQSEWGVIEPYLKCDKLFLEDISTTVSVGRQETDFSLRVVLIILDSRSEDCLATFITGNKPIGELEKAFDARVASRLRQTHIIHLTGKDRRIKAGG